jgi:hypothetical protein
VILIKSCKNSNYVVDHARPALQKCKLIQDYVGNFFPIHIVTNYGTRIAYLLLLQAYHHLNPNKTPTKSLVVKDNDLISRQIVPLDDVILSTLKNKLQIFQRLSMRST